MVARLLLTKVSRTCRVFLRRVEFVALRLVAIPQTATAGECLPLSRYRSPAILKHTNQDKSKANDRRHGSALGNRFSRVLLITEMLLNPNVHVCSPRRPLASKMYHSVGTAR